jgi:3-hydroxybutyryl-CoA dehydrogenase
VRVAVIGAGTMGSGIAAVFAVAGDEVIVHDADEGVRAAALGRIDAALRSGARAGALELDAAAEALACVRVAEELGEACAGREVVVEAVVEDLEVKRDLLRAVDDLLDEGALLATNTSALPIGALAAVTGRAEDVLGLHFFNPPLRMRLVEVVVALSTSERTVERARDLVAHLGKTPVVVRESPGFATSRISALLGNEAFAMLAEGVASAEDIDLALRLGLNHPMGPFEVGDLVGLDVRLGVLEHLHRTLGERFRPAPLLRRYVDAGWLGRKTGRGVYRYDERGRRLAGTGGERP